MYSLSYSEIFLESFFISDSLTVFATLLLFLFIAFVGFFPNVLSKDKEYIILKEKKKQIILVLSTVSILFFLSVTYFRLYSGHIKPDQEAYMKYAEVILLSKKELKREFNVYEYLENYLYDKFNKENKYSSYAKVAEPLLKSMTIYEDENPNYTYGKHSITRLNYILDFSEEDQESLLAVFKKINQDNIVNWYEYDHFFYRFTKLFERYEEEADAIKEPK